ncbi:glycosyltransferase family 2 protein, partial [Phocaeicola sartorii]|uniref:glycosyltransferase family 2 protein n=1 Tax=Phocaeicola sartorii TaxID=671267 RepID=UPI002599D342
MNEKACISVILPFYNNRHTIERAMSSVLAQSYPNWELIVVDDGSDDGGWALVEKIKDPRVRCYRLPHRNANVARNYGIARSHGVYIAMLDADDEWTEDHLTCSLEVLRKAEADGVYGSVILREKNDCLVVTRALQQNESWIDFLLSNGCAAQTSTLFMTSESVKAILWDESLLWHQDYDFMVRYCRKYRMCPKIEATTIYYRSQASKSVDFDSCIRFIKSVENEISLPVYRNYHLQMLHLAVACSADETIVRHYREITAR